MPLSEPVRRSAARHLRRWISPGVLGVLAAAASCTPEALTVDPLSGPLAGTTTQGLPVTAAPGTFEIDFTEQPAYLPKNTMVLTFDDGPDAKYTAQVLDILKEKGVKASFFINTKNQVIVEDNVEAQLLIRRIVDEGHELGSHSEHHPALALLTPAGLEEELANVERTVCRILGERAPRLTLFRAPFGDPYLGPLHGVGYDWIAPIVAKHAVHIGWAIDSNDWRVPDNPDGVFNNVTGLLKTAGQGSWGVMLMHSINPQTVGALPRIIDYIRTHGFVFKLSEDVVRARYGKSSGELIPGSNKCTGPGVIGAAHDDAGVPINPGDNPPQADAAAPTPGAGGSAGGGAGTGGSGAAPSPSGTGGATGSSSGATPGGGAGGSGAAGSTGPTGTAGSMATGAAPAGGGAGGPGTTAPTQNPPVTGGCSLVAGGASPLSAHGRQPLLGLVLFGLYGLGRRIRRRSHSR